MLMLYMYSSGSPSLDIPFLEYNFSYLAFHRSSLGQIDRKFHGHGENYGFVLYEYIIKQYAVVLANVQTSTLYKITCQQ